MFEQPLSGVPHLIGSRQRQPTPEEIAIHKKTQQAQMLMQLTTQIFIQRVAQSAVQNNAASLHSCNEFAYIAAKQHLDFMLQKEAELNQGIQDASTKT